MNIVEKSKEYAKGKINEALTNTVEQAYIDGYKAGYNDALLNKDAPEVVEDKLSFVDLELPDKTLWASDYLRGKDGKIIYFTYDEAASLNIPYEEQFKALKLHCDISLIIPEDSSKSEKKYKISKKDKYICLGSNGFWIKRHYSVGELGRCVKSMECKDLDKNERLPVILVKNR